MIERHESTGVLNYSQENGSYRLVLDVDPGLHDYLRALIPKYLSCNKPKYAPHITLVRNEVPTDLSFWGRRQGVQVPFSYYPFVHNNDVYWWINCFSDSFTQVRKELGLPSSSKFTKPPNGADCFHFTIGNSKVQDAKEVNISTI